MARLINVWRDVREGVYAAATDSVIGSSVQPTVVQYRLPNPTSTVIQPWQFVRQDQLLVVTHCNEYILNALLATTRYVPELVTFVSNRYYSCTSIF